MDKIQIQEYKTNFFTRKKSTKNEVLENSTYIKRDNTSAYKNKLKVDSNIVDDYYRKKKIIRTLNNNPQLLEQFSIDRLEKILKIYIEDNNEKMEKLKKLTS